VQGSLRLSLGRFTTDAEIQRAAEAIEEAVARQRAQKRRPVAARG
jgi:cysteine sulfinate desulfinase/cysteine desulfurase-like protein